MKIWYYVSAYKNLLYGGDFFSDGRYKSYGQHSFIYDFLICSARNKLEVNLVIDGLNTFPILGIVERYCNIYTLPEAAALITGADIVVIDVIEEKVLESIPASCPLVCIIHNAGEQYSETIINRCDSFICMTETAYLFQLKRIDREKLCLITQGVDMLRFTSSKQYAPANPENIRVLYYSRMNYEKRGTILNVLEVLKQNYYNFTVLGDGQLFWEINDRFAHDCIITNYIPCNSIPRFIDNFDVIISSGRGVMEACAIGKPAICAGYGYVGLVTFENTPALLKRNMTGYGYDISAATLMADIEKAVCIDKLIWRQLAETYFNMDNFVCSFIEQLKKVTINNVSYLR